MPCRMSQAVCGLMQAPKSRRPSRRAQQEGAHGALFGEHHVVKAVVGLRQLGKLARRLRAVPVKLPPSTTMPPTTVPWPERNLVAEW